jgi:hypothetical protein
MQRSGAFGFPAGFVLSDFLTLVVFRLTLGESDLDLHFAPLIEIDPQRNDREPFLLRFSLENFNLLSVKKELSVSPSVVAENSRLLVWLDVHIDKPKLIVQDAAKRIGEVSAAQEDALDFRSDQGHAGFVVFENRKVVACAAVIDGRRGNRTLRFLLFPHPIKQLTDRKREH